MAQGVRVKGYRELMRAAARADKETKKKVRETFRRVGDLVKVDARSKFGRYDARSAAGFRTVVRQRGVTVEQRYGRTTGDHPNFGALQMREALIPALDEKDSEIGREFQRAIDEVADHFDRA